MLPPIETGLTPEQITQLETAKTVLPKLKAEIRRAKSAGIDVASMEAEVLALEQQIDKLHKTYVRKLPSTGSTL